VVSEFSLRGRGQGHVSNFYIVDLENFATASRRYTGDIHTSVRSRFVYDTVMDTYVVWGAARVAYLMTSVFGERGQCWSRASSACVLSDLGRRLRLVRCWNNNNNNNNNRPTISNAP